MKLIKRTETGVRHNSPAISLSLNGVIRFNNALIRELNLEKGKKIAFSQDEEKKHDWYFAPDDDGIELRQPKSTSGGMIIQSASIANDILRSINVDNGCSIPVSTQLTEGVYALITKKVMKI